MSIPKVLVLQRIIPHYRVEFFKRLCQSTKLDVTLAHGQASPNSSLSSSPDLDLPSVQLTNRFYRGSEKLVYQQGSISHIWRKRYDVVIAEFNPRIISNLLLGLRLRPRKTKLIWWGHGFGRKFKSNNIISHLRFHLAKKADAMLLYSDHAKEQFAVIGYPRDRIFVALNSLDIDEILANAKLILSGQHRFRVLYSGRLIKEKNLQLLLRAFHRALPRLKSDIRVTLMGQGHEEPHLRSLCEELHIANRVDFAGGVYDVQSLADYYNSAILSVSPGPVGLAAIQCLAFGSPVLVASDAAHGPEISALKEGVNALFFPDGNIEAFAERIVEASADVAKLAKMSKAGQTLAKEQYGLDNMVDAFERTVQRVAV